MVDEKGLSIPTKGCAKSSYKRKDVLSQHNSFLPEEAPLVTNRTKGGIFKILNKLTRVGLVGHGGKNELACWGSMLQSDQQVFPVTSPFKKVSQSQTGRNGEAAN